MPYLPLATNIHPNTLGPTKKVIPIKSNGGDLDSESVGMDPIVEDFGGRYLSLWHIEEIKAHNPNNNKSEKKKRNQKRF